MPTIGMNHVPNPTFSAIKYFTSAVNGRKGVLRMINRKPITVMIMNVELYFSLLKHLYILKTKNKQEIITRLVKRLKKS